MNNQQKEALSRVKAKYASCKDSEVNHGTYSTEDIEFLLNTIDDQNQKIECVKEDLEDLKTHLKVYGNDDNIGLALVVSSLDLLNYEE